MDESGDSFQIRRYLSVVAKAGTAEASSKSVEKNRIMIGLKWASYLSLDLPAVQAAVQEVGKSVESD